MVLILKLVFKKMANYRNRYLEFVKKNYSNYDYMLVVDLDIDGSMSIKKFLRNFDIKTELGCTYCKRCFPLFIDIRINPFYL